MKTSSWDKRATNSAARALASVLRVCVPASFVACGQAPERPALVPPAAPTLAARAPIDFAFDSLDDRPVDAESTRGKPTVIAFITTENLASQAQLDFLVAMAKNDADRVNYAAVALEPRDSREIVELYRKALAIPFPMAMTDAPTLTGGGPFGDVRSVPVVVMLDRSGRLAWRNDGRLARSEELRAAMRGL